MAFSVLITTSPYEWTPVKMMMNFHMIEWIIVSTLALLLTFYSLKAYQKWRFYQECSRVKKKYDYIYYLLIKIPYLGTKLTNKINYHLSQLLDPIKKEIMRKRLIWGPHYTTLPEHSISAKDIIERFKMVHSHYNHARSSSTIYTAYDDQQLALLKTIWEMTSLTNPLHPEWPLINLLEAEIISICQNLFHGESGAPGMITHGGSLAILEACKAYVLQARRNGNYYPEIVAPSTIHIAFDKAAEILNARLIKVPVDPTTGKVNPTRMSAAISHNTCLLVASAPCFPYGTIDPIADLGVIAERFMVPLHIDACLGGFLTAFAKEAGFDIPACDFSVRGVTSITIGTHKYGQTPNGTSVILFKKKTSATPTHVYLDWMGGLYVSPGIDGTRSGADIAMLWATLTNNGKQFYIQETRSLLTLKDELYFALKVIPEIFLPVRPILSIIVIRFIPEVNPIIVADHMFKIGGWLVNPLQDKNHKVTGFHFCLTAVHVHATGFKEVFIKDLQEAIMFAKENPTYQVSGVNSVYEHLAKGVPYRVQQQMGEAYMNTVHALTD